MVSIERAAGWSRQLRLTPLSPAAYIAIKMLAAMVLGLVSVIAVFIVGKATGKPAHARLTCGSSPAFSVWVGSLVFAAFGLFLGYLLPTENVMQFLGLIWACCRFARRAVRPAQPVPARSSRPSPSARPLYGLNQLVHAPLLNQGVDWTWVVNVVIWLAIFAAGRDLAVPHGHRAGCSRAWPGRAAARRPARRAARPGIRVGRFANTRP